MAINRPRPRLPHQKRRWFAESLRRPKKQHACRQQQYILEGHDFNAGDEVVYRAANGNPISGLVDGQSYFVIPANSNEIQLAATLETAIGSPGDPNADPVVPPTPIQPLAIAPTTRDNSVTLSLSRVTDQPIGGLTDGTTYYVKLTNESNQFQLATFANLNDVVSLDGDPNLTGISTLGTEGVDLISNGSGRHTLTIDLTSGGQGTHRLDGVGSRFALASAPTAMGSRSHGRKRQRRRGAC